MLNIFITGGLGYIGSHVCSLLIEEGHNVYILDSLKNSSFSVLRNLKIIRNSFNNSKKGFIKFFKGDIRDRDSIAAIFKYSNNIDHSIDIVLHCAGLKSVKESLLLPEEYWNVNLFPIPYINSIIDLYKLKRTRLMLMKPKTCYYWHNDPGSILFQGNSLQISYYKTWHLKFTWQPQAA